MSTDGGAPNTGTPAPNAPTGGAPNPTPAAPTGGGEWTTGFNDDLKGYVQTKGFKDPASVLDSYRNLEKLMGAPKERLLRLPDKDDAPEWGDVYSRLGRPADAKEYKLEIAPELAPEAEVEALRSAFHKQGLTKRQAEALMGDVKAYREAMAADRQTKQAEEVNAQANALKKEWGLAYTQNLNSAKAAAMAFGLSGEQVDKLETIFGGNEVIKMLHTARTKMGEHNFVGADQKVSSMGVLSPEAAKHKLSTLRQDQSFIQKYTSGDVSAREEMARLHAWAYPDQN